ncbi:MAG: histidine kinase [Saprospiraceae bacterium]
MKHRWGLHLAFWLAYWLIYAYTYSRYDGHITKYLWTEGVQMPARMLATYAAFWCLDRFSGSGKTWLAFGGVALANFCGALLNRVLKMHYVVPVFFPDATFSFWSSMMMVDLFDCALASGTALSARLFFRQQESLRREATLSKEKVAAELQALKSQLQPHFLFNTLNNIYSLARIKSDRTAPVALQLAHLLRFVLYETRKPVIPLAQEVQILQDYIALERLRFDDDRLRVETEIEMDDPQQTIAPLLLLPLVENAFKHGVSEHRSDAWVRVYIALKDRQLSVQVLNSVDLENAVHKNPDGIGQPNLRRQLELLYPGKSRLLTGVSSPSSPESTVGLHYAALLSIDLSFV